MKNKVIPVLRILDHKKAVEFYIDWLGFKIDWEHKYSENFPMYIQISKEDVILHLSEHHGDCNPGSKVMIEIDEIKVYHKILIDKDYKYNKPGLEKAEWGALTVETLDPFGNKIIFFERDN